MPAGRPPEYDAEFHPKEIIRLMKEQGKTAVQVARDWDLDFETLREWKHSHKEFSVAYKRAQAFRRAWWIDKGMQGLVTIGEVRFDSRLYAMMMKYDGINLDERCVKIPKLAKCKTSIEKANCVMEYYRKGKLTTRETAMTIDMLCKMVAIEENTVMKTQIEELQAALAKK